jgi:integrase
LQTVKRKKKRSPIAVSRVRDRWILRARIEVTDKVTGVKRTVQRAIPIAACEDRATHPPKNILKLAEKELERLKGPAQEESPLMQMRVGEFHETIFLPWIRREKKPSTVNGYTGLWRRHVAGTDFEQLWLRSINTKNVQELLEKIANPRQVDAKKAAARHGFGPRVEQVSKVTLGHIKHLLSGVMRHAAREGCMDFDADKGNSPVQAALIPGRAPKTKNKSAYTRAEVDTMLRLLSDPARTVVAVAAFSGLRAGEIRGLQWSDLEPGDQDHLPQLQVRRSVWRKHTTDPKTQSSANAVPLIPLLSERLEAWRRACGNPVSGPMFPNAAGNPISLDSLYWRAMRVVLQKAGVRWTGWHSFRRFTATELNSLGVDDLLIRDVLRHSDVSVTRASYIQPRSVEKDLAMQKLSGCSPAVLQNDQIGAMGRVQ